jgi:hypothetical protein
MMARYIDADALTAEFKRLTLGENSLIERIFADGVYAVIDTFPAADVVPRAEVAREVIKEIEDAINKRYHQHVFSCDLEDTEAEAVMDFHTDLYFDIEKIKEKYGINDADGEE